MAEAHTPLDCHFVYPECVSWGTPLQEVLLLKSSLLFISFLTVCLKCYVPILDLFNCVSAQGSIPPPPPPYPNPQPPPPRQVLIGKASPCYSSQLVKIHSSSFIKDLTLFCKAWIGGSQVFSSCYTGSVLLCLPKADVLGVGLMRSGCQFVHMALRLSVSPAPLPPALAQELSWCWLLRESLIGGRAEKVCLCFSYSCRHVIPMSLICLARLPGRYPRVS